MRTAANLVLKESRFYESAERRAAVSQRRKALADEKVEDAIDRVRCCAAAPKRS